MKLNSLHALKEYVHNIQQLSEAEKKERLIKRITAFGKTVEDDKKILQILNKFVDLYNSSIKSIVYPFDEIEGFIKILKPEDIYELLMACISSDSTHFYGVIGTFKKELRLSLASCLAQLNAHQVFNYAKLYISFYGIQHLSSKFSKFLSEKHIQELINFAKNSIQDLLPKITEAEIDDLIENQKIDELHYFIYKRFSGQHNLPAIDDDSREHLEKFQYNPIANVDLLKSLLKKIMYNQEKYFLIYGGWNTNSRELGEDCAFEVWGHNQRRRKKNCFINGTDINLDIDQKIRISHGGGYFHILEFLASQREGYKFGSESGYGIYVSPGNSTRDYSYANRNSQRHFDYPARLVAEIHIKHLHEATNSYEACLRAPYVEQLENISVEYLGFKWQYDPFHPASNTQPLIEVFDNSEGTTRQIQTKLALSPQQKILETDTKERRQIEFSEALIPSLPKNPTSGKASQDGIFRLKLTNNNLEQLAHKSNIEVKFDMK